MLFFKKHKALSHKQTSVIGFVLAIFSLLTSVIVVYGMPLIVALLNRSGVFHLDLLMMAVSLVLFFSIQGLLLFGIPLSYAHDKKDHMTGFQILLYAWGWMVLMVGLIAILSLLLFPSAPVSMDDLNSIPL
ncbi:MAG: hypothetical protein AAB802_00350 [Patescibacteria group bacterium]